MNGETNIKTTCRLINVFSSYHITTKYVKYLTN